jgi:competence protein ComEC
VRLSLLIFCLALSLLISRKINEDPSSRTEFIVWNVGQGSWATFRHPETCHHFDAGGERNPSKKVRTHCRWVANSLSFSHWDLDHIRLAPDAAKSLPGACIAHWPAGPHAKSKQKYMKGWLKPQGSTPNAASRVFVLSRSILLPGDSTDSEERAWALNGDQLNEVRLLVLGHHGSRTSTSGRLLKALPRLRQAVASARSKKYGHPHKEVADRLKSFGIALLRTEDWGDLRFEIKCYRGDSPCSNSSLPARK